MRPRFRAALATVGCLAALAGTTATASAQVASTEVTRPAGQPRGVVLLIHGGAWLLTGEDVVASMREDARRMARWGWLVYNVDYRPGAHALGDVLGHYAQVRRAHPGLQLCTAGASAGGHLALMVAARRKAVRCVISRAGPADLVTYPRSLPVGRIIDEHLGAQAQAWSPARHAARIRARVLLEHAYADPVVPYEQSEVMRAALPGAQLIGLPAGSAKWAHVAVDPAALERARQAERRLLSGVARTG